MFPITKGKAESERLKTNNRVSILVKSHHQLLGRNANSQEFGYQYYPENLDEPYIRERIQVSESSVALDSGWVQDSGLVLIYNTTSLASNTIPTQEEIAEINSRSLILYKTTSPEVSFTVKPGRLFMAELDLSNWEIAATTKKLTTFKIVVYPN